MKPAAMPTMIALAGPTQPQAGVTATRPATAPDAAPSRLGWPRNIHSPAIHDSAAAAVAIVVLRKASAVSPFASRFEPALKPNQPTHKRQAPMKVKVRLCGAIASLP